MGLFLIVHHRHLVAVESHHGAGDPQALTTDSDIADRRDPPGSAGNLIVP
jgi:hypothetical protein